MILAIAQYSPFLDSQPYEIILWNSKDMELNKAKPQTLARNDNYGNWKNQYWIHINICIFFGFANSVRQGKPSRHDGCH